MSGAVALALCVLTVPALADPALWVAKQGQATVYLFGTVHALKAEIDWWTPKISAAFDGSQEIWLEADPQTILARPLEEIGLDQNHSLASVLEPADLARLDDAAKSSGYPGEEALDHMRPWLAALQLEGLPIVKAGYDPGRGVEVLLLSRAHLAGKPVHGFETADQQMHFFADLPQTGQIDLLRSVLDDMALAPSGLDAALEGWSKGDVESFRQGTNQFSKDNYPDLYAVLVVKRNQAWANRIRDWLKSGRGQIFVAVGAGHMAGPDSLLKALEARGITAVRE